VLVITGKIVYRKGKSVFPAWVLAFFLLPLRFLLAINRKDEHFCHAGNGLLLLAAVTDRKY